MSLFQMKTFTGHSGGVLGWKIKCEYLNSLDIDCFAQLIARRVKFRNVYGIPRGGSVLANALRDYTNHWATKILIVDDVLTTGGSMEEFREHLLNEGVEDKENIQGVVLFARGPCPSWVTQVLSTNPFFDDQVGDEPSSHKEYNQ